MILVVNAGSTSLKLRLVAEDDSSETIPAEDLESAGGVERLAGRHVRAVAHRVVHGGRSFRDPVVIDDAVAKEIFALEGLAPLHNAPALRAIERARHSLPDVPHVAVFDTGFHETIPPAAATYPLPAEWRGWGVRRYGFHGLSVAWCAERVPQLLERDADGLRLVVCHLGGGCSVSAVRDGRSLDTTMGFSPLEGVPMATRSGSIDPGALLYAMREHGLSPGQAEHALNFDSGLLGLAGTDDAAAIERRALAGEAEARLALEVFCHRLAGAIAAMAASMGGIDALAFTAGIGEGSAYVRGGVCSRLGFLGVDLDEAVNRAAVAAQAAAAGCTRAAGGTKAADRVLSSAASRIAVLVVGAKEEIVAARAARALVGTLASETPSRSGQTGRGALKDRPAGGSGPIRGRE